MATLLAVNVGMPRDVSWRGAKPQQAEAAAEPAAARTGRAHPASRKRKRKRR
jgi:hypothetical protein